jgi:hypothetical protein
MKKTLIASAALAALTVSANAGSTTDFKWRFDIITTSIIVLWVYGATTKGMEWHDVQTFRTKELCNSFAAEPENLEQYQGKGPVEKWKCVKYIIARH